jgi:catechol 2,3-dioxygenase-like lactoylglutathione lyase family enzyme
VLLPASALWRIAVAGKTFAHERGWSGVTALPKPTVAIGNLTVGGSGKTPIAAWVAGYFASRGVRPGILLRGVGGDESGVHRDLVPAAVVIENADRAAGAVRAVAAGAEVLHEPRVWPEYHPNYYGAFFRDPDGNNVEAVCHAPG